MDRRNENPNKEKERIFNKVGTGSSHPLDTPGHRNPLDEEGTIRFVVARISFGHVMIKL